HTWSYGRDRGAVRRFAAAAPPPLHLTPSRRTSRRAGLADQSSSRTIGREPGLGHSAAALLGHDQLVDRSLVGAGRLTELEVEAALVAAAYPGEDAKLAPEPVLREGNRELLAPLGIPRRRDAGSVGADIDRGGAVHRPVVAL